MKRLKLPMIEVRWVDSSALDGWNQAIEVLDKSEATMECRTVGYLLRDSKDRIVIAGSVSLSDTEHAYNCVAGDLTIPKCAIIEKRTLK